MPLDKDILAFAKHLVPVAKQAGRAIMQVYEQDFTVERKSDDSPVTKADQLAERIIVAALAKSYPQIPVIAEEAASAGHIPETKDLFFLVDPLDGTKEFIKKSREFTVNIALIDKGEPVFGLIFAPALKQLYLTLAHDRVGMAQLDPFGPAASLDELELKPISTRIPPASGLTVVASKSHMTDETSTFIEQYQVSELQSAGSSLKFCLLARGDADLYPRFGPTMEWDTAAGHAILKAAGGRVINTDGQPFLYGKSDKNYLNSFFIAWAHDGKISHDHG